MSDSLSTRTKLALGVGAVAFGLKESGLSMFLLLYYGQVLGLGELRVGTALLLALVCDALSDPLVGHLSDQLRSRWGRRHPLMYASALPILVSYILLWNPPSSLHGDALFAYLLVLVAAVRLATTFHEIPNGALISELTSHYHERTKAFAYRFLFGWGGGLLMSIFTFSVLLRTTGETSGLFSPSGFRAYGWIAACAMTASVLLSALGTHSAIPLLRKRAPRQTVPGARKRGHRLPSIGLLQSAALRPLLLATVATMSASGLSQGLQLHMSTFFWGLHPKEMALFPLAFLAAALVAFLAASPLSARLGKRAAAQCAISAGTLCGDLPLLLALLGAFPERGSAFFLPLLIVGATVGTVFQILTGITFASMLSDVVEEREVHTGKRCEAGVMASSTLVSKLTLGLGLFGSGFVLSLVGFPPDAVPGAVASETLSMLARSRLGLSVLLSIAAILALRSPALCQAAHLAHLRILQARTLADPQAPDHPDAALSQGKVDVGARQSPACKAPFHLEGSATARSGGSSLS